MHRGVAAGLEGTLGVPADRARWYRAPGRANIIGEHTDYNGGPALPMAISLGTVLAVVPRDDRLFRLAAVGFEEGAAWDGAGAETGYGVIAEQPIWARLPLGMLAELNAAHPNATGLDIAIGGDLPLGAGLSSSASLALAVGSACVDLWGWQRERDWLDMAQLAQRIEHEYVGVRCGMLDQVAITFGRAGHGVRFDAATVDLGLAPEASPLLMGEHTFLVVHSGIRRALGDGPYNQRRHECEEALRLVRQARPDCGYLAQLDGDELALLAHLMDTTIYRRARHVISETKRVRQAIEAFAEGNVYEAGGLLSDSQHSLARDFEVSIPELDFLVEEAWKVPGVLGARLTGAGFGGSILVLLHQEAVVDVSEQLKRAYLRRFDRIATCYHVDPADGLAVTGGRWGPS